MNELREKLKKKIFSLCALPTVSGFETRATDALRDMFSADFDEIRVDAVGNHLLIKRGGREGAPLALVDTHLDEIGMMVTDVCEGGFLKFTSIGGLSLAVLQGADVVIYGHETLRGVVTSTPPHLRSDDGDKLTDIDGLAIDTGYSRAELERLVPIGTPVGFAPRYAELLGGRIAGKSFDNKACAAIAAAAIADADRASLACDVALLFSSVEETSRVGGAAVAAFALYPDYAMVIDVNLARIPDAPKYETVPLGEGVSLSIASCTDRALTEAVASICDGENIAYSPIAAPSSTGTNAPSVNLAGAGIPVVDIGLPLKNMHTYNEVVSLDDACSLYSLVGRFITSEKLADGFRRRGEELPI